MTVKLIGVCELQVEVFSRGISGRSAAIVASPDQKRLWDLGGGCWWSLFFGGARVNRVKRIAGIGELKQKKVQKEMSF